MFWLLHWPVITALPRLRLPYSLRHNIIQIRPINNPQWTLSVQLKELHVFFYGYTLLSLYVIYFCLISTLFLLDLILIFPLIFLFDHCLYVSFIPLLSNCLYHRTVFEANCLWIANIGSSYCIIFTIPVFNWCILTICF